jgi:hypothetical protein
VQCKHWARDTHVLTSTIRYIYIDFYGGYHVCMHRDRLVSDERKTMTRQLVPTQADCQEVVVELRTIPHCIDARCIDRNLETVACKAQPRQLQVESFPKKC